MAQNMISNSIRKCCLLKVHNKTYFNEKEGEKELQN